MSQIRDALLAAGVFHNPLPPFVPDRTKADPRLIALIDPEGLEALRGHYLLAITVAALQGKQWQMLRLPTLWESFKTIKGNRAMGWFVDAVDNNPNSALDLLDEEIPMP